MTQHAYPCVCTINVKTGQIIDYDCGRVIGQWHQDRPTDCSCPYSQAEDFNCPVHGLPAYRKQPDTPYDAIADTLTPSRADQPFDIVQKPKHYNSHPSGVENIEVARHLTGDWFNTFKYVFRADLKNGRQDLEKAMWYAKDGNAHLIPIHAPTWSNETSAKLLRIIQSEPDDERRRFYSAIRANDPVWAMSSVSEMLKVSDS